MILKIVVHSRIKTRTTVPIRLFPDGSVPVWGDDNPPEWIFDAVAVERVGKSSSDGVWGYS